MSFAPIESAVEAIAKGEIVIVVDGEDRENEGDLIMAAEAATPAKIAFFLAHTSGVICVPLTPERLEELDLPLMVSANTESQRTAFTVSVDARTGTTTGISASDRAATVRALVDPLTTSEGPEPARAHLPAQVQARGSPETRGSHRGCGRPRNHGRFGTRRGALRSGERGQVADGDARRARVACRSRGHARDFDRGPRPLQESHRKTGGADRRTGEDPQ